ncbi:MAG: hypothetical protein JKY95_03345 [Planctomycetaceae bacterium]|nr:hypothetical protein [Planctomycetaceae bacterium]
MRIIAQRCLYGVDINPLAVEMAKLSLWLLTLAKDMPFEFLDHAIRCGDSLVGLHDLEQLKHFSLKPDFPNEIQYGGVLENEVPEAISLRLKLESMPANTVEDIKAQEKLLAEAEEKIARLRCAADLLVAAEFWGENAKDKQEKIRHAAVVTNHYIEKGPTVEFEQKAEKERRGQKMFHWPLEFPEVIVERGGFDAFVGNPPFMGGTRISSSYGSAFLGYLKTEWGAGGRADLCCYFFNKAASLSNNATSFGLIATNTISEGDSREMGLDRLLSSGFSIYRANRRLRWPGAAALEVVLLWIAHKPWLGQYVLDDISSKPITAFLTPAGEVSGLPNKLINQMVVATKGVDLYGMGFVLDGKHAEELIANAPKNRDVILPFMNGDDLNTNPKQSPSRFVIAFWEWPLDRASAPSKYSGPVAADYPECLTILEQNVKPERLLKAADVARAPWWQFWRTRRDLYHAVHEIGNAYVCVRHTKFWNLVRLSSDIVFSDALVVFALPEWSYFTVLQSSLHEAWAWHYCSTLGGSTLRYGVSDALATFAFPTTNGVKENIGISYHEFRQCVISTRSVGLTEIYNAFHDPKESSDDIQKLHDLHIELDQAVAAAYGWDDLDLGHGFHETKQGLRFTISEPARREVLQRLLKLNHERYAEEVAQGLHDKKKKKAKKKTITKKKAVKKSPKKQVPSLFDMDVVATVFPSSDRDNFLCGLLCDLVAAKPGLHPTAYLDAIVIVLQYEHCRKLLIGTEQIQFVTLCKKLPKKWNLATQQVSWSSLQKVLSERKAVIREGNTLTTGSEIVAVRNSYPACDTNLILLILKASSELRELQMSAKPDSAEPEQILSTFNQDKNSLCGEIV